MVSQLADSIIDDSRGGRNVRIYAREDDIVLVQLEGGDDVPAPLELGVDEPCHLREPPVHPGLALLVRVAGDGALDVLFLEGVVIEQGNGVDFDRLLRVLVEHIVGPGETLQGGHG